MNELINACTTGDLEEVNAQLALGIDATADNNRAIRFAARNGHVAVIERLLLVEGVDASAMNNFAMRWAAQNGHLAVINRLLQIEGVDAASAFYDYMLLAVARNGHQAGIEEKLRLVHMDAVANVKGEITFFNETNGAEVMRCKLFSGNADVLTSRINSGLCTVAHRYINDAVVELMCEGLRLQLLADFYHGLVIKGNFKAAIEMDKFIAEFTEFVMIRMDKMADIQDVIAEKIIKKTFESIKISAQVITIDEVNALENTSPSPLDLFNIILDYCESLPELEQSEPEIHNHLFGLDIYQERSKDLYLLHRHILQSASQIIESSFNASEIENNVKSSKDEATSSNCTF